MAKPKPNHANSEMNGASEDDLHELLARSERENVGLLQVLEQAQTTQRALVGAQKRIKSIEARYAAEHAKAVAALTGERDAAKEAGQAAADARDAVEREIEAAAKAARALAAALIRVPDPLAPHAQGDDEGDLKKLRAALSEAGERKESSAAMVAEMAARARALVEAAAARVALQGNRVKSLRKQVESLEGERDTAQRQVEQLREAAATTDDEAKQAATRFKDAQSTITSLRKDLDATGTRLERSTKSSLDAEGKALAEREKLAHELKITKARADDLAKQLAEARKQLRAGERMASDLAQAVVDAGDEMIAAGEVADAPAVKGARAELEELAASLAEAVEDDLEEAFHEDLCDDLVPATRALADVLVGRHKRLHDEIEALRKNHDKLEKKQESTSAALDQERQAVKAAKTELVRTLAQLKSAQQEFEQASKELASRSRELGDAKGELARLGTEAEALQTQAAHAKQLRSELDGAKAEIEQAGKLEAKRVETMQRCEEGLHALGKGLVDLATATEAALAAGGMRAEGAVGRFTRTMRKLEGDVGKQQADLLALLRSSADMVDKATSRIAQLQGELVRRGETLAKTEADGTAAAKERDELSRAAAKREKELGELREERDDLAKVAKRVSELEPALSRREDELSAATKEAKGLQASLKQCRAELDEAKAREAATLESAEQELALSRKRLEDEGQSRRVAESAAADAREEADARAATADAKAQELEKAVDARDARIATLQKEVASGAELRGRLGETQRRAEALAAQVAKANDKVRTLEGQLEEAEDNEQSAKDLASARSERDELAARLRGLEKKHAEERGAAASAKAQVDSLKRRMEERAGEHRQAAEKLQERCDTLTEENRRLKEQLAGLNARVRTLTAH
jgi:chromosome segregation protein